MMLNEKDKRYLQRLDRHPWAVGIGAVLMMLSLLLVVNVRSLSVAFKNRLMPQNAQFVVKLQALETQTELEKKLKNISKSQAEENDALLNLCFMSIIGLFGAFLMTFGIVYYIVGLQNKEYLKFLKANFKI